MRYNLLLSEDAEIDIEKQADWYNIKQKGLGNRFYKHTKQAFKHIQVNAHSYEVKYIYKNEEIRWFRVSKSFPFLIHFVISKNVVIILGVLNEKSQHQEMISVR